MIIKIITILSRENRSVGHTYHQLVPFNLCTNLLLVLLNYYSTFLLFYKIFNFINLTFYLGPTPIQFLTVNITQIRTCLENAARETSKHYLVIQGIQKWVIKLIWDTGLSSSLDTLVHHRAVFALSLYYLRYNFYSKPTPKIYFSSLCFYDTRANPSL